MTKKGIFCIFLRTACPHKAEVSYETNKKSNLDKIKKYSIHPGLNSGPIASLRVYKDNLLPPFLTEHSWCSGYKSRL